MTPEFSRLVAVDRVPLEGMTERIAADARECEALARRFGLVAIHALSAVLKLEPWRRGGLKVTGRLEARVEQTCVVTLEPFEATVKEDLTQHFSGQSEPGSTPVVHSVESLEEDEPDVISGGSIDLGELVAETLGLSLDPYPRRPDAEFRNPESPPEDAERPGPFAALQSIRGKTGRKGPS